MRAPPCIRSTQVLKRLYWCWLGWRPLGNSVRLFSPDPDSSFLLLTSDWWNRRIRTAEHCIFLFTLDARNLPPGSFSPPGSFGGDLCPIRGGQSKATNAIDRQPFFCSGLSPIVALSDRISPSIVSFAFFVLFQDFQSNMDPCLERSSSLLSPERGKRGGGSRPLVAGHAFPT